MDKSTIALIVGALGFVWGVFVFFSNRKKTEGADWQTKIDHAIDPFKGLPESFGSLNAELQVLKKQMEVFWRGVSFSAAQALHSPHTPELDTLLEKFQHDALQDEKELHRLKEMLREIANGDPDPFRRKLAQDTLTLIHVRFDIGGELMDALRQRDESVEQSLQNFSARLR